MLSMSAQTLPPPPRDTTVLTFEFSIRMIISIWHIELIRMHTMIVVTAVTLLVIGIIISSRWWVISERTR